MTVGDQKQADSSHADIGIVCALRIELAAFLDRCDRVKKYTGGEFVFRGGRCGEIRVAVVESGIGFARARRATQALIEAHSPTWIIASGFSGALMPAMKVGDIVVANSLVDTHGQKLVVDLKMTANPEKGLYVGRIITTDELIRTVQKKQELAERYGAAAVDLESLAVAQVCREEKKRFLTVRTISDDMLSDLPPEVISLVGATGSMRFGAVIGAIWERPASIKKLWELRESAHVAADHLATFLGGVVAQLHEACTLRIHPAEPPVAQSE